MMQHYIYSTSKKLSEKQKNDLLTATEHEESLILPSAFTMCSTEIQLGEMFDKFIKEYDQKEDTLEAKQTDYCLRNFVVDNKLIDTKFYSVNLNPDNIELNFDCTSIMKDLFEILEQQIKEGFKTNGTTRKKFRCLTTAIKAQKTVEYQAKNLVMADIAMTEYQKHALPNEYIEKMKILHKEMTKCVNGFPMQMAFKIVLN